MSKRHGTRAVAVVMAGVLLLLGAGCNEGTDFDPSDLFSIEDYAQDQHYVAGFIAMMNQWAESTGNAKDFLDTNEEGLTFVESVPAGWNQIDEDNTTYPWYFPGQGSFIGDRWYFKSFQDASYEFASFDKDVPADNRLEPAKVEYMQLQFLATVFGGSVGLGDSVMVQYADDFANESKVIGEGKYWSSFVVTAAQAPDDIAAFASMVNTWRGTISNMSPNPSNPQGEYMIEGETLIVRADLVEQTTLDVRIEASLRANARGDATIWVEGEERARIVFESFDTTFHGYFELRRSQFKEAIRF